MLSTDAPFPYPGSFAVLADGQSWRVLRHNADGTITLTRTVAAHERGASRGGNFLRTVEQAELHDPASPAALRGEPERTLALRLAYALRAQDEVSVARTLDHAHRIVTERGLQLRLDQRLLNGLLTDLGWKRGRGEGGDVYRRIATPPRRVDLNSRQTGKSKEEQAA